MRLLILLVILTLVCQLNGQQRPTYNDGPYIEVVADTLISHWIDSGVYYTEQIPFTGNYTFNKGLLPRVEITSLETQTENFVRHDSVDRFIAISDIHGQHDLFIKLLQAHQVIDRNEQWIYGDGHLVIVGDIMDRGDGVTESLWFLYALEHQALQAGGRVHTLLGNHELMVMHGDVGYIHRKYRYTSGISQIPYPELFNSTTILGRWLRSKNIVTVINNIGFVHGGFSEKVISKENSMAVINNLFKDKILSNLQIKQDSQSFISLLYFENGPLWYRGYADPTSFNLSTAQSILNQLGLTRLVVGHTSMPRITSVHNAKILLIDSSIKFGKTGEVLVFQNDSLFRGLLNGKKEHIQTNVDTSERSLFNFLHDLDDPNLGLIIDTDLGLLTGKNRLIEAYQPAQLVIRNNERIYYNWNVKLRTRGNTRKKVCHLPPIKLKINKSLVTNAGFLESNTLKLVLPCGSAFDQQALFREYMIYKLYEFVDEYSIQARLISINLLESGKEKYDIHGYLIEDEEEYCRRTGVSILTLGTIVDDGLERESYLKMMFFQYMILNTDFGVKDKHNLELIAVPGELRTRAVPYDFDCSGIVNQLYAVPFHAFPIDHVRERFFRGKNIKRSEVVAMQSYYNTLRPKLERTISQSSCLSITSKKRMQADISSFYRILNNPKKWKVNFQLKR